MAIGRITGPMLVTNLERQGIDLSIDGNLIYFDVTNTLVGINTDKPQFNLDVRGEVFAGNTITVGYKNDPLYVLPTFKAPDPGSILISGHVTCAGVPHETLWSNVIIIDQERRLVGIDRRPEYKLDINGNIRATTDANIGGNLWVGQRITVGDRYHLPTTTPGKNSYLMALGGPLSETVWVPNFDPVSLRRRRYCKIIPSLLGYAKFEFVMILAGSSNIVYELTVSRPVRIEVFARPEKDEPNPYTFLGTSSHLVDDGTVFLNDGSSYQSRQYSIFANLEDPPKNRFYVTVTSVVAAAAALPVIITLWYYPSVIDGVLDPDSKKIRVGNVLPVTAECGEVFYNKSAKSLHIYADGGWQVV